MSFSFYNGVFAPTEKIGIPLTDRSLYFGDGIYDAAIGKGGKIFLLEEHLDRLLGNAPKLSIPVPYSGEELTDILFETVRRSGYSSYFVYFQLSRNGGKRNHIADSSFGANLLVTVSEQPLPKENFSLRLVSFEDKRFEYCDIKTLNLLPSVLASTFAAENGCDEAVFHRGDIVTECAHSNISILKEGRLYTHPADNHILPGITRRHLISAAKRLSIPVVEEPFTTKELMLADEIIVTSTTKLIASAVFLDRKPVGGRDPENLHRLSDCLLDEYYSEMG